MSLHRNQLTAEQTYGHTLIHTHIWAARFIQTLEIKLKFFNTFVFFLLIKRGLHWSAVAKLRRVMNRDELLHWSCGSAVVVLFNVLRSL